MLRNLYPFVAKNKRMWVGLLRYDSIMMADPISDLMVAILRLLFR